MPQQAQRTQTWQQLVGQLKTEYEQLDLQEKTWIDQACSRIMLLQDQLDLLFRQGDGLKQCENCQGDCCALGHNHMTLANILLLISQSRDLPELNFASTCPLLGPQGCQLPAAQRPYNCISFLCDRIEDQLQTEEIAGFYRIEKELRALYRSFASRYTGGSMSGLLLAARRLQGGKFLSRIDTA